MRLTLAAVMHPAVVTKDPTAVAAKVLSVYLTMFPFGDKAFVPEIFDWAVASFEGRHQNYQAIDALYHDLEHTMQGTLCMALLLQAWHSSASNPRLTQRIVELGLIAILLHDTGYLKQRHDTDGSGAKYTLTHVKRSCDFAAELLAEKGFAPAEIRSVQSMIQCTGLNAAPDSISFDSELERLVGYMLGTADLLGQMAADDYIEKLPLLYQEFAEAARYEAPAQRVVGMYSSAEDLMRRTPEFWENFVQVKLSRHLGGLYRYLNHPYPQGPNSYIDRIEANMARLRQWRETLPA